MTAEIRVDVGDLTHTALLAALYAECFEDPWSTRSLAAVLTSPGTFVFIAVCEAAGPVPVGFALARHAGDDVEVISLAVLPSFRRRGVGARLLGEVVARARRLSARRVILEVAETNEGARALYMAHGFAAVGRRPDYYQRANSVPVAALTLACELHGIARRRD